MMTIKPILAALTVAGLAACGGGGSGAGGSGSYLSLAQEQVTFLNKYAPNAMRTGANPTSELLSKMTSDANRPRSGTLNYTGVGSIVVYDEYDDAESVAFGRAKLSANMGTSRVSGNVTDFRTEPGSSPIGGNITVSGTMRGSSFTGANGGSLVRNGSAHSVSGRTEGFLIGNSAQAVLAAGGGPISNGESYIMMVTGER